MSNCEHEVRFTIKPTDDACRFHFDVRAYKDRIVAPDEYSGATEVTPSHVEQVLPTTDKLVRDDITVNPAPTEILSTDHNGTFTPSDGKVGFSQVDVNVVPDLRPLSVSENGTYQPDGFDGYSDVTVDVEPNLTSLAVTENGLYLPESGVDGFDRVSVDVPVPSGSTTITQNGTYNVEQYASAVVDVPSAEWTTAGIADGSEPFGVVNLGSATFVKTYAFYQNTAITELISDNATVVRNYAFSGCTALTAITFLKATSFNQSAFDGCRSLYSVHAPLLQKVEHGALAGNVCQTIFLPSLIETQGYSFNNTKQLEIAIFPAVTTLGAGNQNTFKGASKLATLVLGYDGVVSNANINNFDGTPFANGGSGGDIYIPKALYDHLGDGSNLDYLSNPRWNTLNGYGTITWHPIEGSEYETYMPGGAKYEEEMALT